MYKGSNHDFPVDGGNHPREAQPQKHVDRVASRHVADAVVRVLLLHCGGSAGEQVGQGGAERHQRDRVHRRLHSFTQNCLI